MAFHHIPEQTKPVDATAGAVTTNGGVTGQWITAKDAIRVTLVLQLTNAVGFAEVITIKQAKVVAGTGTKTGPTCNIWLNEATATNDTLVKQTAGTAVTTNASISKKLVIFDIDPATLDWANGFNCIGVSLSDSSQATNFVAATWLIEYKYQQATPPSAVTD